VGTLRHSHATGYCRVPRRCLQRGKRETSVHYRSSLESTQLIAGRSDATASERRPPLSVLLIAAERALAAELEEGLRAAGLSDLRAAHAQVFLALDLEGSRLTDLASRAGMTKQAMGELVRYLEHHAYLEVEPDSRDRRAKLIRPTERGRNAHQASVGLLAESDRRLAERLGEEGLRVLRTQLGLISGAGR
jgi:DNA-binding MarR family transcriptional regulator